MTTTGIEIPAAPGATASVAAIRHHEVTIDRPESEGGTDMGPMGGELLLAALGGCFASTLIAAARARGERLGNVKITVQDRLAEAPTRFNAVKLDVQADGCAPSSMAHLVLVAERGCIVANTLRPAVALTVATNPSADLSNPA